VAGLLRRHLFACMIGLSVLLHVALGVWLARADFELPVLIPLKEGRESIRLLASLDAQPLLITKATATPPVVPPPELLPLPKEVPVVERPPVPPPELLPLPQEAPAVQPPPVPPPPPKPKVLPKKVPPPPPPVPPAPPKIAPDPVAQRKPIAEKTAPPSPSSEASRGARVDELPTPLTNFQPPYPPDRLAAGIEGKLCLRLKIDAFGKVVAVRLLKTSGDEALDQSAVQTAWGWRLRPARRNGVAVPIEVDKEVEFSIRRRYLAPAAP
jgi:periplasmic protein TonB